MTAGDISSTLISAGKIPVFLKAKNPLGRTFKANVAINERGGHLCLVELPKHSFTTVATVLGEQLRRYRPDRPVYGLPVKGRHPPSPIRRIRKNADYVLIEYSVPVPVPIPAR